MTLSAKARRNKGANGEREFLGILRELLGRDDIQRNTVQSRIGGADCEILLGGTILEIKRQEKTAFPQWLEQARAASEGFHSSGTGTSVQNPIPAVAYRKSREPWRVLVELSPEQYGRLIASGLFEEEVDE